MFSFLIGDCASSDDEMQFTPSLGALPHEKKVIIYGIGKWSLCFPRRIYQLGFYGKGNLLPFLPWLADNANLLASIVTY